MAHRILDQVLDREARNGRTACSGVDLECGAQAVRKTTLLDRQVLPHQVQFLVEHHFVDAMPAQRAPQQTAQLLAHARRTRALSIVRPYRDRIERIEKEMRVELGLQRSETRAGQLLREPAHLQLSL